MSALAPYYHDEFVLQTTLTGSALKHPHALLSCVRRQLDSFYEHPGQLQLLSVPLLMESGLPCTSGVSWLLLVYES